MIQAVGFDLDDTLYSRLAIYERTYAQMEKRVAKTDVPFEVFEPIFETYSQDEFKAYNRGEKTREQYSVDRVIRAYRHFGYSISYNDGMYFNAVYHAEQKNLNLRDGILECIAELKKRGIQVFVLTNGSSEGQWKKIHQLKLTNIFPEDCLFVSGDFEWAKPDARIYHYICQTLEVAPENLVYFGDNISADAIGACEAGCQGVWYDLKNKQSGEESFPVVSSISAFKEWLLSNI